MDTPSHHTALLTNDLALVGPVLAERQALLDELDAGRCTMTPAERLGRHRRAEALGTDLEARYPILRPVG